MNVFNRTAELCFDQEKTFTSGCTILLPFNVLPLSTITLATNGIRLIILTFNQEGF